MGYGLALSNDGLVLATGAPNANGGHVIVWQRDSDDNVWHERYELYGENNGDQFGSAVALSADGAMLVVGEYGFDQSQGRVRAFLWDETAYVPRGTPRVHTVAGVDKWEQFGTSVALSNDGLVFAATADYGSHATGTMTGFVRVFAWNDGNGDWEQRGQLNGINPHDYFGRGLALSADGSVIAVGASGYDHMGEVSTGYLSVRSWDDSTYQPMGDPVYGIDMVDGLGGRVSLSADGLVVVANAKSADVGGYNAAPNDDSGYARVFAYSGGQWESRGDRIYGTNPSDYTSSVALNADGSVLAIGSIRHDGVGQGKHDNRGHARAFAWTGTGWDLVGDLEDMVGEAASDELGFHVALSGDSTVLAVGAPKNNGNDGALSDSGHVRVYVVEFHPSPPPAPPHPPPSPPSPPALPPPPPATVANPYFTSATTIATSSDWPDNAGFEITRSSASIGEGYDGWKSFEETNPGVGWATSSTSNEWVAITYPSQVQLHKYTLISRSDGMAGERYPRSWQLQASNGNNVWTDIGALQVPQSPWVAGQATEVVVDHSVQFSSYRILLPYHANVPMRNIRYVRFYTR
jgi:hypothetical protein